MSTATKIEWTDRTWNPVRGCSRVSPGCDECYAMKFAHRFSGPGKPYEGLTTLRRGKVDWTGVARFIPEALAEPLSWRKPQRVFVNSMSDLFHHSLTNEEIAAVFGVMAACPHLTFQVLTKRPARMLEWFGWHKMQADADGEPWIPIIREAVSSLPEKLSERLVEDGCARDGVPELEPWPLPNVWLGVSTENQQTADERIPLLLRCPAAVRFVSAEPLLGPLELQRALQAERCRSISPHAPRLRCGLPAGHEEYHNHTVLMETGSPWFGPSPIDWVIVGGESGPGARRSHLDWFDSIVDQCGAAQVPVFVKQLGAYPGRVLPEGIEGHVTGPVKWAALRADGLVVEHLPLRDRKGGDWEEWPEHLRVREFPPGPRGGLTPSRNEAAIVRYRR